MSRPAWNRRIYGPDKRPEHPWIIAAWKALAAPSRKPTADDAPKLSTLPMTRAAREALRLDRER